MRTTPARIALASLALAAAAGPAVADDGMPDMGSADDAPRSSAWTVDAGAFTRWFGDSTAASLAPDRMIGPMFTIGRRVLELGGPAGGLRLSAFARVAGGMTEGQLFQTLDTRIDQLVLAGGARLDLALWDGIGANVQLDVGAARTAVIIGDSLGPMAPVDDVAWGVASTASVGVTYHLMLRRRFSIGLGFDVGYTVTSAVDIHAEPRTEPEAELSIPAVYASLGDLDTRGLMLAFSVRGGF